MLHLRSIYPDPECFDKQKKNLVNIYQENTIKFQFVSSQVWTKLRVGKKHGSDATFKSEGLGLITTAFMQLQLKISLFKNRWNCIPREISLQTAYTLSISTHFSPWLETAMA